jgi:dTDP-4-amino-4,6-dideoxygalactose transaminase
MSIPMVDLVGQYRNLREDILPAMERVMDTGQFILGEEVGLFESEFARYCGVEHCVGVNSGTDALLLALRALDIGPGDEVITAANTFIATALAISNVGADPVLVDVREGDFNLDPARVEEAITPRTRAIIPVHLYGQPADMDALRAIAERHDLRIVEDACQAHGAWHGEQRTGTLGDIGCFSFYPGKNLGAYGDGGAVVTNDAALAGRLRLDRQYGQKVKYVHESLGLNSRLDSMQAAVLRVKLRHLDEWNDRRRALASLYTRLLEECGVVLPQEHEGLHHVWHLYVIRHPERDALLEALNAEGIGAGIHYPVPIHEQTPYRHVRTVPEGAPVASALAREILSLPLFPEMTGEQVERVVAAVRRFTAERPVAASSAGVEGT